MVRFPWKHLWGMASCLCRPSREVFIEALTGNGKVFMKTLTSNGGVLMEALTGNYFQRPWQEKVGLSWRLLWRIVFIEALTENGGVFIEALTGNGWVFIEALTGNGGVFIEALTGNCNFLWRPWLGDVNSVLITWGLELVYSAPGGVWWKYTWR